MSNIPKYTHNLSLRLSHVLNEIGVNEKMVMKRRRVGLLEESLFTLTQQLLDTDTDMYWFGSQIEGTTTHGLKSDSDLLSTINMVNVIQDWSEWKPGKLNLLMIQDDIVSQGYCLLQVLRNDAPLPENVRSGNYFEETIDAMGRVLMKYTIFASVKGGIQHGPARMLGNKPGFHDSDVVLAYFCKPWPVQTRQWLHQLGERRWPSDNMREYCMGTECFLVPVGNTCSENVELEWRISTSLAERCLMFNLNITQIRCYILMKMIMKTFITTLCPDSISSFMCKTVLLNCISNTRVNHWKENNLLSCLTVCLSTLYNCVSNEYCPHLMIPGNNLMERRFTPEQKQMLLETLFFVITSNGNALLEIECDQLSLRIQNLLIRAVDLSPDYWSYFISGQLVNDFSHIISHSLMQLLLKTNSINQIHLLLQMLTYMSKLLQRYNINQTLGKIACIAIAKHLSITLGSVLASININNLNCLTREALGWIKFGLDSDVSSGKLKLSSTFYCKGETERTEMILKNIKEYFDRNIVESGCYCYEFRHKSRKKELEKLCYEANDEYTVIKSATAFCIRFLRCEINCCPVELQFEMFRSTQQDLTFRDTYDSWMDLAVVDALPFLYFLQYKTYKELQRHEDKQKALFNLTKCIKEEPNFAHRETALNLLGQCMEQENRINDAFNCYFLSLKERGRNNAVKIHICKLICLLLGNNQQ